jgi:hypothetical protein
MIIIHSNKKSLYYRILILIVLWSFFFYFYHHFDPAQKDFLEIINLFGIGLAALYYTPVVIITTLFRPIKVTITPDSLIFFKILMSPQTLKFPEIQSFSTQSYQSANGKQERVIIIHSGNKTLKVADMNVESIRPVIEVLHENNIAYSGHTEKPQGSFGRQQ